MVEVIANSLEDHLIDGLSFKPTKTASYVTKRRSCTYHAQGSNRYSAVDGTKLINMLVSSHDWLDPSTFRIMSDFTKELVIVCPILRPIQGAWPFFNEREL